MASRYIANTAAEQKRMLGVIGAGSLEELLVKIPAKARLSRPLGLRPSLAETDLIRHMKALAARNADADSHVCFMGAGSYDHYVPSPINHLISRGEFFTAYTPYQPEASQGTLRTIYEYQTMIAELLLRVRGDADAHPVAFRFRPLVLARVLEIFGDVGHGYAFFTREGWNGVLTTRAAFAAPRTSTASSVPTPASGASTYAMAMYLSTDGP